MTQSYTEQFDAKAASITEERGKEYPEPLADFTRVAMIKDALNNCKNPPVRHALEMIGVKMVRLAHNPDHIDSIIDIAGYARTIVMVLDKQAEQAKARVQTRVSGIEVTGEAKLQNQFEQFGTVTSE